MYKFIRCLVRVRQADLHKKTLSSSSSIVQHHEFNLRTRAPGESIAAYVAALQEIAKHCDYKDSLNDMLEDRLIVG